MTFSAMNNTGD